MVTLPLLEKLRTSYNKTRDLQPLDFTELSKLQSRSSFDLSEFSLDHIEFQAQILQKFLKANPSLAVLKIDRSTSITIQTMRVLMYFSEDTDPILPALKNLSIREFRKNIEDDVLLVEMIKSRWWSESEGAVKSSSRISRLDVVHICIDGGKLHPAAIERLNELREEGLDLTLIPS